MIRQNVRISMLGRAARLGLAMLAVLTCFGVQPVRADAEEPCTYGNAQVLLQMAPVAATQSATSERPKLGELWEECQFRLYRDGETITFHEDDYIVGAIAVFWFYEEMDAFGWTRAEAIDDLRLVTDRVEMAVVTDGIAGSFESVPLIVTRYRDALLFGSHIVFNQRAFITQLPAGEYLVHWTQSYPGFPDYESTVRLSVAPA